MRSLLCALLVLPLASSGQSHGEILGQVQSGERLAVGYATVSIYFGNYLLSTTLADADGVFIFGDLQPGVYTVVASFGDSRSKSEVVWVTGGKGITYVDVSLRKAARTICNAPGCVSPVESYLVKRKPEPGLLF